jgi:phage baseplate assembly protein W
LFGGLVITLQVAFPDEDGILRYKLFNHGVSKKVAGNPLVEQLVTKLLFTTPGTDLFDPAMGGGLLNVLSQRVNDSNMSTVSAEIGTAIIRTESQIIASQSDVPLDPSEQLLSIDILSIDLVDSIWKIELQLNMADGNVKRVLLEN